MIPELIVSNTFRVAFNEATSYLKSKASSFRSISETDIDNAFLKAANVENVKTIWQIDKTINLNNFYYPSKIRVNDKQIIVESIYTFSDHNKVVIEGTAGQGKSILLRYLSGKELKTGKKIPLFMELRKLSPKISLEQLILNSCKELGIPADSKTLEYIFTSGSFILLLDAFDEVTESEVKDTISYIESICNTHSQLKIIITARPGAEIQKVTYFSVYKLEPLRPSDFEPLLLKFFSNDVDSAKNLVSAIHKNKNEIANLITTPLLLTLLTITYKAYSKIPEQLHDFYDNLFSLLVNRHDSTKPGFTREFKTKLSDKQLEDLFCAFTFYSMIENKVSFSSGDANSITTKAKKITNLLDVDESKFLSDCHKNTCLIIKDGFEYHFIHKSIREYHAAKFIKNSPLPLKEKFYSLALTNSSPYIQELNYLKVIDEYYFVDLFLIEKYKKAFDFLKFNEDNFDIDVNIFKMCSISFQAGRISQFTMNEMNDLLDPYFEIEHMLIPMIFEIKIPTELNSGHHDISFIELNEYNNCLNDAMIKIKNWAVNNHKIYRENIEFIKNKKNIIENLDF